MPKRKYEVCGTDEEGDVHIFRTDDRERAEEVAELMREDLEDVELSESEEMSLQLNREAAAAFRRALAELHVREMKMADIAEAEGREEDRERHCYNAGDYTQLNWKIAAALKDG